MPTDLTTLRRQIDAGWLALTTVIDRLSVDQLATTGPDGWSVADHLAHLTAWERSIVFLLQGRPRHDGLGVPEATYHAGFDATNAAIQAASHGRPPTTVLAELRATHADLLATLAGLTDVDLRRTYSSFLPDEPGRESGEPIVGWIAGNTYEHYAEHIPWFQRLLDSAE
jgi:hypothetical protein